MNNTIDLTQYLPKQERKETGLSYFTAAAVNRGPHPHADFRRAVKMAADLLDALVSMVIGACVVTFLLVLLTIA